MTHAPVVGVDDEVVEESLRGAVAGERAPPASARAEAAEAEVGAEEREAAAARRGDVVAHHLHLVLLRGFLLLLRLRVALRHPPLRPKPPPHGWLRLASRRARRTARRQTIPSRAVAAVRPRWSASARRCV